MCLAVLSLLDTRCSTLAENLKAKKKKLKKSRCVECSLCKQVHEKEEICENNTVFTTELQEQVHVLEDHIGSLLRDLGAYDTPSINILSGPIPGYDYHMDGYGQGQDKLTENQVWQRRHSWIVTEWRRMMGTETEEDISD